MTEALILWHDNWVTFIDGLLQLNALRHNHEGVSVAKQINRLCINVNEHSKHLINLDNNRVLKAEVFDVHNFTRCGGILIEHLKLRDLPLESDERYAMKTLQFVPRFQHKLDGIMTPVPQEMPEAETERMLDGDRVVISGMSGLYPQSHSVKELSDLLYNKVNPIQPNSTRWKYSHPEVAQCTGMLPDLDRFDAQFFKVHYRLCNNMDSMARKVLEQAYQAIYDAGVSPEELSGKKVGVYIGSCFSETEKSCVYVASSRRGFGIAGCSKTMFANRISFWLNAKGPSVAIDEACCSSLAALEQACSAIKRGECEAAVVGGTNLCLHPQSSLHYSRIMKLCQDGKTKSFDQNADGCVKSEAINVLFLQKAQNALRIYAEVLHVKSEFTAITQTEKGPRYGFYRDPKIMAKFLKTFYDESGVAPHAVEYVEAFGSAVSDADKVELEAIDEIFCKEKDDPLLVGSVMSNIGFSEAASGISAITKVLLGYHKGQLAGNLHCEQPRQDVEAIREGRLRILTDHTSFGRSYTAVNGLAVTGVNAHVLMHGRYKPKDLSRYKCDFPRLVTISGRHDSAVKKILEDLKVRPIDPEELALLYNVYKTKISGHMARGFIILDSNADENTVSLCEKIDYFDDAKRPLWFVYSGMGSQWAGMGAQLMRIPIFAAAIERCHKVLAPKGINIVDIITSADKSTFDNILHSFVGIAAVQIGLTDILNELGIKPDNIIGHSVGELGCAYADGCLTAEEMILSAYSRGLMSVQTTFIRGSMAAVGVGYQKISKMCPPEIEVACHNGPESSTISGPADIMQKFVGQLTAKGIFAKEVPCSNIAYHSRYIAKAGPGLLKHLREVIKTPKPRSERWVSTSVPQDRWSEPIAKLSSAEYHTNNLLSPVLFEETAALIPSNAVLVEIAPHGLLQAILKRSLPASCCNIPLTRRGHPDNAYLVLEAIGKLYMEGYTPIVEALYPKVEFPVSSSTPMLSHTVEWAHDEKWPLPLYVSANRKIAASCKFVLSVHDEEYSYLQGHVLRGKTLFPFAASLVAVWDTLAMSMNVPKKSASVEFRDVHLYAQPVLHDQRQLRLSVSLHRGSGRFEVLDDVSKVATGIILINEWKADTALAESKTSNVIDLMDLKNEDVYTLLCNKHYSYSGDFRSIYGVNLSMTEALIQWHDNWVTFIDGLLQLNALRHTHEGVSVAKQINRLCINVNEHSKHLINQDNNTVLKAEVSDVHKITRCGGILIEHLKLLGLPLESDESFAMKTLQFVPRFENKLDFVSTLHVYLQIVGENVERNNVNIAFLVDYNKDLKIFNGMKHVFGNMNNSNFKFEEINIQWLQQNRDKLLIDINLVVIQDLSADMCQLLHQVLKHDTFVVSEQDKDLRTHMGQSTIYRTLSAGDGLQLIRWRPTRVSSRATAVSVRTTSDIPLLKATRAAMQPQTRLLVLSVQPPPPGLTDLIRSWRNDTGTNHISLVAIDSTTIDEPMDTDIGLAFNIWNKGAWGGEYYVPLQEQHESTTKAMLQSARVGDIGSLQWVQAPEPLGVGVKINVHYAGINTVDVFNATGLIPFVNENETNRSGYGMDFSGITESGCRVMGVVSNGACSSEVHAAPEMLWPVPDHWSLEDAATVPLAYLNAFYCYLHTAMLVNKSEQLNVLIHGGAGALGQAAISIGLGMGHEVFTTVSDATKKQFLLKLFPQLKEKHIGNSRDNSFGDMVLNATNGEGCCIVINNVRGDLKNVSLQCCGNYACTYDLCQLGYQENYTFQMSHLTKERSYVCLDVSSIIRNCNSENAKMLHEVMSEGIARGYVRPLSRVTYAPYDAPRAFRLLAASAHRGRVLLDLRDIDVRVLPRIHCKFDEVYLILWDQSSLGLHLVDRLISRGARKLHLHCVCPPNYLRYKISCWRKQDVQVKMSSEELNHEGISALIDNANKQGNVGGIYIIASDASTTNDEKFVSSLSELDFISRNQCPSLRYFTVISSSDMKGMHTCLDRVNNGYPATLLKLNLSETNEVSEASAGSVELSASQCQGVMSVVERAVHSAQPVLVAHHLRAHTPPLLQQLATVAGVAIPENSPDNATLESFGIQNEKSESIRKYLELYHNVALVEDVTSLTINRIREIEDTILSKKLKEVKGLETFYTHVDPEELLATTELVFLPTLTCSSFIRDDEFDVTQRYLCIVPGLEGLHNRFNYLCERLKLQPGLDRPMETIQDTAKNYAQVLLKKIGLKNNFNILGYEWGVPSALEVASILEAQGMVGTVFCVGDEPEQLKVMLEEELSEYKNAEELQNGVLEHMFMLISGDKCTGLEEVLQGCRTWDEKVDACVRTLLGRVSHSAQYARSLLQAALGRIVQARRYNSTLAPLRSRLVLLRPQCAPHTHHTSLDLQLSELTSGEVFVHELSAPLAHAARDARCAAIINSHLDSHIVHEFNKKNLCDTYLLNADTFMTTTPDND